MSKSRSFTIYLLKEGQTDKSALKEGHALSEASSPTGLPENSTLYILDAAPKTPWLKVYFGLTEEFFQHNKGAILFVKVKNRCFALAFGLVMHYLKESAYEYDFGLNVTLNSLDPKELKSTDTLDLSVARRQRTQLPVSNDLTYMEFDKDSQIIRSLTGKVKEEYKTIFSHATGSSCLKVSFSIESNEIPERCEKILELYESREYENHFPEIRNIIPIKDPKIIGELDGKLVEAFRQKDENIVLTIPDIVDYRDRTCCIFLGDGDRSDICPEINITEFYEFYQNIHSITACTLDDLKSYRTQLTNSEGNVAQTYSIYRSLVFDFDEGTEAGSIYHFSEGSWYKVDRNFARRLKNFIDERCVPSTLISYNHDVEKNGKVVYSEENYNEMMSRNDSTYICLDQKTVGPDGQNKVEPCDLYRAEFLDDRTVPLGVFYHVKISTDSSLLSHLFNQGINSIEVIKGTTDGREKMIKHIEENIAANDLDLYSKPIIDLRFKVIFAIITRKEAAGRSENIPLFSRISLMRVMQKLDLMSVGSALMFIPDASAVKAKYHRHHKVIIEIVDVGAGIREARPIAGQEQPHDKRIKGCSKVLLSKEVGTKWILYAKKSGEQWETHNTWKFYSTKVANSILLKYQITECKYCYEVLLSICIAWRLVQGPSAVFKPVASSFSRPAVENRQLRRRCSATRVH